MKKYLKMSDVFDETVRAKYQHKGVGNSVFEECGALLGDFVTLRHAEYAAHAINSHDELVEINNELLAALVHLHHNARASGVEMGLALDVAEEAIAKAKGGAA